MYHLRAPLEIGEPYRGPDAGFLPVVYYHLLNSALVLLLLGQERGVRRDQ